MYGCIITVRSITYAFKGEALLKNHGIDCKVVKTDGKNNGGCKYGISIACNMTNNALAILKNHGIEIGKIMA